VVCLQPAVRVFGPGYPHRLRFNRGTDQLQSASINRSKLIVDASIRRRSNKPVMLCKSLCQTDNDLIELARSYNDAAHCRTSNPSQMEQPNGPGYPKHIQDIKDNPPLPFQSVAVRTSYDLQTKNGRRGPRCAALQQMHKSPGFDWLGLSLFKSQAHKGTAR
jgi:hypothetical protein